MTNGTVIGGIGLAGGSFLDDGFVTHARVRGIVELWAGHVELTDSRVDGTVYVTALRAIVDRDVIDGTVTLDDTWNDLLPAITRNRITNGSIVLFHNFSSPDIGGTIAGNVVRQSPGAGIDLDSSSPAGLSITGNRVIENHGDGIIVGPGVVPDPPPWPAGSVTFRGNVAVDNGGHGFNLQPTAPDAITDGGGNIAVGNGLDPQCIGIACTP